MEGHYFQACVCIPLKRFTRTTTFPPIPLAMGRGGLLLYPLCSVWAPIAAGKLAICETDNYHNPS